MVEQHDSIQDFLDSLILEQTVAENTGDKIILSTIHSAKGLEFDTVFVTGCLDGVFPTNLAKQNSRDFNEELRCFYVAITRPKRRLYMIAEEFNERRGEYYDKTSFLAGCDELYREVGDLNDAKRVFEKPQREATTSNKIQEEYIPTKLHNTPKRNRGQSKPHAFSFRRFFR